MQVYCTKLCYLSGQVLEEDMIQDISSTILNDPYNSDVIYVTESDKPGYVQEISTATAKKSKFLRKENLI